ncbi:MAG: TIGR00266 family protein [Myxococcales bacterium]|nr:TIGR00266 family protein [Myxococcales bacterium]
MKHQILQSPDFGMLDIVFEQAGEQIVSEAGAMVGQDSAVQMETNMRGGLGSALKRKMLGGESLFQNTFTASGPGERLQIAPPTEGDIMHVKLDASTGPMMVQSSGYLASTPGVNLDTKWGGAKGFFSGAGMFLIKAEGQGDLWISSYGAIHRVDVGYPNTPGANGYTVDTGHILAFSAGVDYTVTKVGGLKSLLASGEGLVAKFHGQGQVYLMTRNPGAMAAFIFPYRPVQSN